MLIDMWERFLKSLESEGGKVIVLLSLIGFFLAMAAFMVVEGHAMQETARTLLATGIGSLLGILYGYLARRDK
jgi:hypothetical protein